MCGNIVGWNLSQPINPQKCIILNYKTRTYTYADSCTYLCYIYTGVGKKKVISLQESHQTSLISWFGKVKLPVRKGKSKFYSFNFTDIFTQGQNMTTHCVPVSVFELLLLLFNIICWINFKFNNRHWIKYIFD